MNEKQWTTRLRQIERESKEFNCGFKFLFVPWDSLNADLETAFLSIMPSYSYPPKANIRLIAPKVGNDYIAELRVTRSPINKQFEKLTKLLNMCPEKILTGVATPFRVKEWDVLSKDAKQEALKIGNKFWNKHLQRPTLKLIIACGQVTRDFVADITGVNDERKIKSGWGNVSLRRFQTNCGKTVVHLPDLSWYKLLSRDQCIEPLNDIFHDYIK